MTGGRTFAVRPVEARDMAAVTAIYAQAVLETTASFELAPPSVETMTARMRAIVDAGLPCLVADDAGAVLGYAYATVYRPRPAYRFTVEDSIYVAPTAARRGVGRALLGDVIAACERQDYRQMLAVIGGRDNAASIALHGALGFEHVGRLPSVGRKFDRWHDSVLMQRALGGGDTLPA